MDRQILNFTANEQTLIVENPIRISTNKVNYIEAHFALGTNWSGYDSVRAVWFTDYQTISTVLDSQGVCRVPFEVMKRKGQVKVDLVGSISEGDVLTDRLTSYPVVAVIVDCVAPITGAETSPITPSQFEQFVANVRADADRAEAGAEVAETSADEANASATASAQSATASANSASQAQTYAQNAQNYTASAETAKDDAIDAKEDAESAKADAESARDQILGMRATANTLAEGSDATASYSDGVLTLGIPRGNTGATGAKGPQGPQGETGPQGPKGDTGDVSQEQLDAAVTDLKSELTSEADARIALASRVATAETDIDTLEIHKVAQPLDEFNQPTDGTDGQSLRTKGDGTTEWADVGLPTDAQTAQAVSDWLDEHPEATTTVQDHSLTFEKLVVGTLGYVTPIMFGAKGDGATVDNIAINNCFAFCVAHGLPCYGENKTYLVDDSTPSLCNHFGLVVNGGITIRDCHFKLKSGCPDMTTLLACKYDSNQYVIENCTFEGELRTITSGREDGGNHGIIFCDGITMSPSDWQSFADITVKNCDFVNIQSYGIFPTPIDNRLLVEKCNLSCHAGGILAYATNSFIRDCSYTYLSGSNTSVSTLAVDEIENFSSASAIKKNIFIADCTSNRKIFQIQHTPQQGVVYGNIRIERCVSYGILIQTYYDSSAGFFIAVDSILIKDCSTGTVGNADTEPTVLLRQIISDNVVIDNLTVKSSYFSIKAKGAVEFRNCHINYRILAGGSQFTLLKCKDCVFSTSQSDGFITTRWSSIATSDLIQIINCCTESASVLLRDIDADNIYVNGLIGNGVQVKIFFAGTATDTNIYVDGLIMPIANSSWNYFIENITGKAVIRGMSAGLNTIAVSGGVTKEITTIPAT